MELEYIKRLLDWSDNLKVGDKVKLRWTNSGRFYQAAATVTKVNEKTILAAIDAAIMGINPMTEKEEVFYETGRVIKVPRIRFGVDWTNNNGAFPID